MSDLMLLISHGFGLGCFRLHLQVYNQVQVQITVDAYLIHVIQVEPIVIHQIGNIGQLKELMKLHVLHRQAPVILDIHN